MPHANTVEADNDRPSAVQVARVAPEEFWKFSLALFASQRDYFDIPTSTLTPTEIREKLTALVAESVSEDKAAPFKDLVTLKTTPNGGVDVTEDLKYTSKSADVYTRRWRRFLTLVRSQSSSPGRMASTSRQLSCGTASSQTRSPARGASASGPSSSRRRSRRELGAQ